MKITLDPEAGYITENKKYNKKKALMVAGVKAAVCFRESDATPEIIRDTESNEQLLKRGLNTILSDHTSPSEQPYVSLEIVGIPKILCMLINNEHEYAADERSLRYTPVKKSVYISDSEVELYDKWLGIFRKILETDYMAFFKKCNKKDTEEKTIKAALSAIEKIAQENARYMVSVFTPTTITYTAPLAQINKICLYMQDMIDNPLNNFEKLLKPSLEEFIKGMRDLDVIITEHDAHELVPSLNIPDTDNMLYRNNKHVALSLFSEHNKFSGINLPNEYGTSISYNMDITLASLAQFQRHRTMNFEMKIPNLGENKFYTPLLLNDNTELQKEWIQDINTVNEYYPQGKLVHVNMNGPLKHLVNYIGKERACDRAFLETEDMFTNKMLPDIYKGLLQNRQYELADATKPYINNLRCMYPDYNCPSPCGHPRVRRLF